MDIMMGMSASLALWLEPLGNFITISGFVLLLASIWHLARRRMPVVSDLKPAVNLNGVSS